nr:MAG TPA: hypothetical protein [Caudoviricetes sp.]
MTNEIIQPMAMTIVRDAICQLLASERDKQIKIAQAQGMSDDEIANLIDFVIYPKRLTFPDVSGMPCVFVYFNQVDFPADQQDIYENYAIANLQLEFYAAGKTETGRDSEGNKYIIKTDEENAEDRLSYLSAQLYKILNCERNVSKGTDGLVTHSIVRKWERIKSPEDENSAVCVLGAAYTLELGFSEPTSYLEAAKIKELYITLDIQDQYIDPFVRIILDKNKQN